jgi:serine/threonine protein kinase
MLVQDYAEKGDLFNFIKSEFGMPAEAAYDVFAQMIDGVAYLHSLDLVHRDIKPENVVVDAQNVAKLCDFGMMGHHGKRPVHGSGTTPYMAPELHASHKHGLLADKAHDIWALGVSLYVLLTGDFPWLKAVVTDVEYAAFLSGRLRGKWSKFSPQLVTLFQSMLSPVESRITVAELQTNVMEVFSLPPRRPSQIHEDEGAIICDPKPDADASVSRTSHASFESHVVAVVVNNTSHAEQHALPLAEASVRNTEFVAAFLQVSVAQPAS